jgi:hypothetical protein
MYNLGAYAIWQIVLFCLGYFVFMAIPDYLLPPDVRKKLTSFRANMLTIAGTMKDLRRDRPATWINTLTHIYNLFAPARDPYKDRLQQIPHMAESVNVKEQFVFLLKILCKDMNSAAVYPAAKQDGSTIHQFNFVGGGLLFVKSKLNEANTLREVYTGGWASIYLDGELDVEQTIRRVLQAASWQDGNSLLIETNEDGTIKGFVSLDLEPYIYEGALLKELPRWRKAREAGIKRRVLLQGRPGTGKTTFCYHIARTEFEKTLVFSPESYKKMKAGDIQTILAVFEPDIVIVNDIDSLSASDFDNRLDIFELNCPHMVIYTSNDLGKIPTRNRRPGRIDETIVVDPSDKETRKVLIHFCQKMGVSDISEDHLVKATAILKELGPAHAQEYIIRLSLVGNDYKVPHKDLTFSLRAYQEGSYDKNTTSEDEDYD